MSLINCIGTEHRVDEIADKLFLEVVDIDLVGACGEGFVRCAYATSLENIKVAMGRISKFIARLK